MNEDWGAWIEHDMLGIKPFGAVVYYQIEYGSPSGAVVGVAERISETPSRRTKGGHKDDYSMTLGQVRYWVVIRYRVRKPKGLKILEALLQDLPESVDA